MALPTPGWVLSRQPAIRAAAAFFTPAWELIRRDTSRALCASLAPYRTDCVLSNGARGAGWARAGRDLSWMDYWTAIHKRHRRRVSQIGLYSPSAGCLHAVHTHANVANGSTQGLDDKKGVVNDSSTANDWFRIRTRGQSPRRTCVNPMSKQ